MQLRQDFCKILQICVFYRPDSGRLKAIFDFQFFFQNLCPSNLLYTYNVIFKPILSRIYYLSYFIPNYWDHCNQKEPCFKDQTKKIPKLWKYALTAIMLHKKKESKTWYEIVSRHKIYHETCFLEKLSNFCVFYRPDLGVFSAFFFNPFLLKNLFPSHHIHP